MPSERASAKILVLTSSTGSGHDSTAHALVETLQATVPEAAVAVWDPLEGSDPPPYRIVAPGHAYDWVVAHRPWLWKQFYHGTNREPVVQLGTSLVLRRWGRQLRERIATEQPDLVISVHPLCARIAGRVLYRLPRRPAHYCVVTDLVSVHRCWASHDVDLFCVPTPQAARALVATGVPASKVRLTGLPLRRGFMRPPAPFAPLAPPAPRRSTPPLVLLLCGGYATPALERAAHALLAARPAMELTMALTIVCGHNARLYQRLAPLAGEHVTILAWHDDIAGLMRACSVVVTKAGSVTLAEAFSQDRPVILYHAFPGQEDGNNDLICAGVDGYVRSLDRLPAAVAHVLARPVPNRTCREALWWGTSAQRVAALVAAELARGATRGPVSGVGAPPGHR